MSWGDHVAQELGFAMIRFGFIAAGAGFALGCIAGIGIGWLLFGGGA